MRTMLFLTILCFLSCGTDQGETKTYTYSARNESGVLIKILAYNSLSTTPHEIIYSTTLENGNEIKKIFEDGLPPRGYNFSAFFANLNGRRAITDSIKVIYNNTKYKSFISEINCSGEFRNPLNTCIYSDSEEIFTFTVEDYENAEDCNGNCE
jgi:hypothetical protein